MSYIRKMTEQDLDAFARISADAYPGFKIRTPEERQRFRERLDAMATQDPMAELYGLERDGRLLGGMRLHRFSTNLLSQETPCGGIGMVAVHFLHKKEKVARDLLLFALRHFRESGHPVVMLYPFRPDFYKKMGFGFGARMYQYRIKPAALPKGTTKEHVVYLSKGDAVALLDCYNAYYEKTHGMCRRYLPEVEKMLENPRLQHVGVKKEGKITAYFSFAFKEDPGGNFLVNDMVINEIVYLDTSSLYELLTFLNSQSDQIRQVILSVQDPSLHFLLDDPRDGTERVLGAGANHSAGAFALGLMYRVVDIKKAFEAVSKRDFNGQSITLAIDVEDSFLPENSGLTVVEFDHGAAAEVSAKQGVTADATISLNIADFSSLFMGAVSFRDLLRLGRVRMVGESFASTVNEVFRAESPVCMTNF